MGRCETRDRLGRALAPERVCQFNILHQESESAVLHCHALECTQRFSLCILTATDSYSDCGRNAAEGYYFEVPLMPDQKKVNFHHWVGLLTHKGAHFLHH